MNTYEENLSNLTEKQREAVEYINGSLLVIAGPGTGKTQLLSMRVAEILKKTDTNPQNILCLTFTNKAAINMKNRLQQLVGSEALQVNVKTFHSLAAEIMNEYPEYFWNGANLITAPDAIQTDIIESILSKLPLDNPLAVKFAGNYTSITRVQNALKLAKEAGLTPEKLKALVDVNLAYINSIEEKFIELMPARLSYGILNDIEKNISSLPDQDIDETVAPLVSLSTVIKEGLIEAISLDEGTNKTKHTGAWRNIYIQNEAGNKGMHKQRRANEWWLNLADVYSMYRDELHKRGYYDYSDMLIEVISQLEKQPAMLSDIQERYQYIMIDEFQDSNAAQMRLAHLIVSHPTDEGNPNLMVVGDDDQSIYKFNGAELNNMLSYQRMYPKSKVIVLEDNFRSTQEILNVSKTIIELAEDRLVKRDLTLSKNLKAKIKFTDPSRIIHKSYPSKEYQLYDLVNLIKQEIEKDSKKSIAVLARKHESLENLASELFKEDIPINYERKNNILNHSAVKQIIIICRIAQAINDGEESIVNQNIAALISHPMWKLKVKKLWQLAIENRYRPHWLDSLLDNEDNELQRIGEWLLWISELSRNSRIEIVLDYILGLRHTDAFTSPFRQYYIYNKELNNEYIEALSAIQKLRSIANEFTSNKHADVKDFIKLIDLHEENNISINDESVFTSSENAVQLLTIHKAKGLEFDTVYIIDSIEKEWQPKNRGSNVPINLPLQPYGEDMDDYVRLMYVASTRAKQNIIATSYRFNSNNEEVSCTPLIKSTMATEEISQSDIPNTIEVLESGLKWPSLEINDARNILKPILDDFSLNVTSLLNFLDLTKGGPEYFLERNLLRLPSSRTTSLAFGTAIHNTLEQAQRQINKGNFDLDNLKQFFISELNEEPILPEEIERWQPHGLTLLDNLFENQLILLPEGGIPEQKLQGVNIGNAIIEGKLDHVITAKEDNSMLITDFKTGAPLKSFYTKDKSVQVKLWKHKTQLIFYALLAKNHPLYKDMHITCQMMYLEANNPKEFYQEYTPTDEDIERLIKLSRSVFTRVKKFNLPDVSKYSCDIEGIRQFEEDLINESI